MNPELEKAKEDINYIMTHIDGMKDTFQKTFGEKLDILEWFERKNDRNIYVGWKQANIVDTNSLGILKHAFTNMSLEISLRPVLDNFIKYDPNRYSYHRSWWGLITLRWVHPSQGTNGYDIGRISYKVYNNQWEMMCSACVK